MAIQVIDNLFDDHNLSGQGRHLGELRTLWPLINFI
jgi:hypothetical protein